MNRNGDDDQANNNGHHSHRDSRLLETIDAITPEELAWGEQLNDRIDALNQDAAGNESDDLIRQLWTVGNHAAEASPGRPAPITAVDFPTIPGYAIDRLIGRGGMGVVFGGTDERLHRRVAIKVLPASIVGTERARNRFEQEVQAAAQLQHPHIVTVFGIGEYPGGLYYSMREIDGIDLAVKLRDAESSEPTEPFGPEVDVRSRDYRRWVAMVGKQLAEAVAHSHDHGIVHRDIKPANVIIDRQGNAHLADFGLARIIEANELTGDNDLVGTVFYMSPEQVSGGQPVDERTDIYSLGCTLYETLTGRGAVTESHCSAVLRQISDGRIASPRQLNPTLEVDLETIILKAITTEPAGRYASAQDLADDLQRFLDTVPVLARRATPAMRLNRWARRNRRWVAALVALTFVALFAVACIGIVAANRTATYAGTIRTQATRLLDISGIARLREDDPLAAAIDFAQAAELTADDAERSKQNQRVSAITNWSARLIRQRDLGGRMLVRFPNGDRLVKRSVNGKDIAVLIAINHDEDNKPTSETIIFETTRKIDFATRSDDGDKIAIVVGDRTNRGPELKLLDIATMRLITLPTDDWRITNVWFTRDGETLVTTGWGGKLTRHDLSDDSTLGREAAITSVDYPVAPPNISWVYIAAANPSRTHMVASLNPGRLVAYSLPDFTPLWKSPVLLMDWNLDVIAISQQGTWVAVSTTSQGVRLWHVASGREWTLDGNVTGLPTVLVFAPDEQKLAAGDNRGGVYVWDLPAEMKSVEDSAIAPAESLAPETRRVPRHGNVMSHALAVTSLDLNDRGEILVGAGNQVQAWRLSDNQPMTPRLSVGTLVPVATWQNDNEVRLLTRRGDTDTEWTWGLPRSLQVDRRGPGKLAEILVGLSAGTAEALVSGPADVDTLTRRDTEIVIPPSALTRGYAIADSAQRLVFADMPASNQFAITTRRQQDLTPVGKPVELSFWPNNLRFNQDGSLWMTNDFTSQLVIADVASGQIVRRVEHPNWITDAMFVGDGQFASICWDQNLRIWDSRGSELRQFELEARPTILQSDSHTILVGAGERIHGYTRSGDRGGWMERFVVQHDGTGVQRLAIHPDQDRWLSCSLSGSNRLWSIDGEQLAEFHDDSPVRACQFSPDGRWLATISDAGHVHIRHATIGEIMTPTIHGRTAISDMRWFPDRLVLGGTGPSDYWLTSLKLPDNWMTTVEPAK